MDQRKILEAPARLIADDRWMLADKEAGYAVHIRVTFLRVDLEGFVRQLRTKFCNEPCVDRGHAFNYLNKPGKASNTPPGVGWTPSEEGLQTLTLVHTHPDIGAEKDPVQKRVGEWPSLADLFVLHGEASSNRQITEFAGLSWFQNPMMVVVSPTKRSDSSLITGRTHEFHR